MTTRTTAHTRRGRDAVAAGAAGLLVGLTGGTLAAAVTAATGTATTAPPAVASISPLLRSHHCWLADQAPAVPIPRHVLVRTYGADGGARYRVRGPATTGRALAELDGHDEGVDVVAFCR